MRSGWNRKMVSRRETHAVYARAMARDVIDAALLHLIDSDLRVDPAYQLVAPNTIRSEALQLLVRDVRQRKAVNIVAVAPLEALLVDAVPGRL
jgi:hypothetical protein